MPKALVIVESPTKAKTINKYLGKNFIVKASLGHIKDLPKRDLAVDVENGFRPKYEVIEGKKKLIQEQGRGKERRLHLSGGRSGPRRRSDLLASAGRTEIEKDRRRRRPEDLPRHVQRDHEEIRLEE